MPDLRYRARIGCRARHGPPSSAGRPRLVPHAGYAEAYRRTVETAGERAACRRTAGARMIRYAGVASDGSRTRAENRETVDDWAKYKCAAGFDVEIYTKGRHMGTTQDGDVLVGRWMA